MPQSTDTLIKRYETSAETFDKKGRKEWAYAKNGLGDEHYAKARTAFEKANQNKDKAEQLKRTMEYNGPVIKPNNFVGKTHVPLYSAGATAAGMTAVAEGVKATINGDSFEKATSNVVSKSMESAVNASIADVVAKVATAVLAASNPLVATGVYLATNIVANEVVSEITEGSFDEVGKEVGRVGGNIEYAVSEGISEIGNNVMRVADNLEWAASNALSDLGAGFKSFFLW